MTEAALEAAGVGEVVLADRCTICDPRYFSHRASGGMTGRQAGIVWRRHERARRHPPRHC